MKLPSFTSSRRKPGSMRSRRNIQWIPAFAGMTMLLFFCSAAKADDYLVTPPGCEFTIAFPTEPYFSSKCDPQNPENCTKQISFTKVFGMEASVNATVICNPLNMDMAGRYTREVMQATLEAMSSLRRVSEYQTDSQETPEFKRAILIGTGQEGQSEKIYTSQLWVGKTSVFILEAELVGQQMKEADDMFAGIIRSVAPKGKAAESAAGGDKKKDEKTPEKEPEKPAAAQ